MAKFDGARVVRRIRDERPEHVLARLHPPGAVRKLKAPRDEIVYEEVLGEALRRKAARRELGELAHALERVRAAPRRESEGERLPEIAFFDPQAWLGVKQVRDDGHGRCAI